MSHRIQRRHYADIYGPTTGDRVRLGDTNLWARVEHDHTVYGDECKFGGGKVLRDGMGQASGVAAKDALDLVVTNALVIDWSGVFSATAIVTRYVLKIERALIKLPNSVPCARCRNALPMK